MHAVTFAKPHSLASPARPRDVGRVQRRVMHLPVSAPASSNRTDDGAVTESEDVEVRGVARRGLMANVARVGTVLSYGAVLAGCAHTAHVAASRQQRREETQTQNEDDADVVTITQRLSALALAFTLTSCGPALAGAGEKKSRRQSRLPTGLQACGHRKHGLPPRPMLPHRATQAPLFAAHPEWPVVDGEAP